MAAQERKVGMWPHKDMSWWALLISIVALILMVPLGIATNVLTPKLQNWWASRSRTALSRRIDKLEAQVAASEELEKLSSTEDMILLGIEGILACFPGVMIVLLSIPYLVVVTRGERLGLFGSIGVIAAIFISTMAVMIELIIDSYRKQRSPIERTNKKRQLRTLNAKLEKK
jgi:hypothetical protein